MDKPKTTPKDFFLWTGAIVAFYWSVIATIFLIFNYIDYTYIDPLAYYPSDPYQSGIPYQMASIIVLVPVFLALMWLIRKGIASDPSRKEIWVRRWALIFTLFLAGIAIAGDLITLLTKFLSGDTLTPAFLLKVLVILLIAAAIFMHFTAELKGYWEQFPMRKRYVSIGVGVLAAFVIVSGFFIVGTPQEARLARYDSQKATDLQDIQYRITNYYQAKQKLPTALADLANALNYGPLPVDPQTGETYSYLITGPLSFKLCTVFNTESRASQGAYTQPMAIAPEGIKGTARDNWQHGSGNVCFERTIDPSFYPPLK